MTTTAGAPIESHAVHRDRMLEHAGQMLAARDRLQASEKMWGAVAHAIKAIAVERGWPYEAHADAHALAWHIADCVSDKEIFTLYLAMESLHRNFYDDRFTQEELGDGLDMAQRLVSLLRDADDRMAPSTPMPKDANYRRRAKKAAQA